MLSGKLCLKSTLKLQVCSQTISMYLKFREPLWAWGEGEKKKYNYWKYYLESVTPRWKSKVYPLWIMILNVSLWAYKMRLQKTVHLLKYNWDIWEAQFVLRICILKKKKLIHFNDNSWEERAFVFSFINPDKGGNGLISN